MKNNILKILGVQNKEDVISNALAFCFNNSRSFKSIFLEAICGKNIDEYNDCKAYTRISTSVSGVPDIVLLCAGNNLVDLVIIENKLKAEEGTDQTKRYSTPESVKSLINKLNLNKNIVNASFIFLTLFPDQVPSAGDLYKTSTYLDLIKHLPQYENDGNPITNQLLKDWNELLEKFYSRVATSFEDNVLEKLKDDEGLDGGYLYFRSMLSHLDLPLNLKLEEFCKSSQQGRRYYLVRISKLEWHPEEMSKEDDKWQLDPKKDFNIHIEPQYNMLNESFSIYLHYEVNPYYPDWWVKKEIPPKQLEEYHIVRSQFFNKLRDSQITGISMGGGSNQIAKAVFDIRQKPLKEVLAALEDIIKRLSVEIDSILHIL